MEAVTLDDVEKAINEKNIPSLEKIIGQKCTNINDQSKLHVSFCLGVALCINYNQSPSVLAAELEAFLLNNASDTLTLENFGKFEQTMKSLVKVRVIVF